jgi:hypothetical protein
MKSIWLTYTSTGDENEKTALLFLVPDNQLRNCAWAILLCDE